MHTQLSILYNHCVNFAGHKWAAGRGMEKGAKRVDRTAGAPTTWDDFENWGESQESDSVCEALFGPASKCSVVIRSRHASTSWERLVRTVVGDPVHLDVVLVKEGSAGARFCFSSYMNQKFEMVMMDQGIVHDKNMSNMYLEITEEEHERCTRFMMSLVEKASYDYLDAMLIMPMAPKVYIAHYLFFGSLLCACNVLHCMPDRISQRMKNEPLLCTRDVNTHAFTACPTGSL